MERRGVRPAGPARGEDGLQWGDGVWAAEARKDSKMRPKV